MSIISELLDKCHSTSLVSNEDYMSAKTIEMIANSVNSVKTDIEKILNDKDIDMEDTKFKLELNLVQLRGIYDSLMGMKDLV